MTELGPLAPGDRVALVAPAGPTGPDDRVRAEQLLRSWGLVPVTYPAAGLRHARASYLSGDDAQRAWDFEEAWCDPSIAGIFALRGGFGTVRILDRLDPARMQDARPKPVYGSSDVTALHEWLREELGASSWFTPMIGLALVHSDRAAVEALRVAVLEGPRPGRRWSSPAVEILVPGRARGILIGGNLSLLAMTLGARGRRAVDNFGAIALLEDVNESAYRLDGYLTSLLRAGWFNGVVGVVLGSWQDCAPLAEVHALCLELLGPVGAPMVSELGFGHGPGAHSIPLGQPATLVAEPGRTPELVLSPAVRPVGDRG